MATEVVVALTEREGEVRAHLFVGEQYSEARVREVIEVEWDEGLAIISLEVMVFPQLLDKSAEESLYYWKQTIEALDRLDEFMKPSPTDVAELMYLKGYLRGKAEAGK
jgi:hypothetical protein